MFKFLMFISLFLLLVPAMAFSADIFPSETCWGQTFDIYVSGQTGDLVSSCIGDSLIAISIAIWEHDGWPGADDRVVELWLNFETHGLSSGVPYSHLFENVDLSVECDHELDLKGEFYVEVKGPCLPVISDTPIEDVPLIFLPTAPELVAPADNQVFWKQDTASITFQWNSIYNTSFYEIQVDDDSLFTSPVLDEQATGLSYEISQGIPGLVVNNYYWRVRSHNNTCGDGNWSVTREFIVDDTTDVPENLSNGLPLQFSLSQNHPNPFNMSSSIEFALPRACHVSFDIYNISGQKVRTLIDEKMTAGINSVVWDGTDDEGIAVSSGVYLYRITADDYKAERKMILLK